MTLTPTELGRLRRSTGADNPNEYSDFELQYQYDRAATDAPSSASILPYSYVYILRDLWAIRTVLVDRTTDHGDRELRSQIRDATKKLLDYWEAQTGLSAAASGAGNVMRVGALQLDINTIDPDDEV